MSALKTLGHKCPREDIFLVNFQCVFSIRLNKHVYPEENLQNGLGRG